MNENSTGDNVGNIADISAVVMLSRAQPCHLGQHKNVTGAPVSESNRPGAPFRVGEKPLL